MNKIPTAARMWFRLRDSRSVDLSEFLSSEVRVRWVDAPACHGARKTLLLDDLAAAIAW
jgi:hypothetical protein